MESRLTTIEAILASLATREDLARAESCLEGKFEKAIHRLELQLKNTETSLHKDIHILTWRLIALLAGLLPSLFAAAAYIVKSVN